MCSAAQLVKRAEFDQMRNVWSNAARFVNWSYAQRICPKFGNNELRICPNAQIGQMRLTVT